MGLLVMVNQEQQRSWFHGVDLELLRQIAASLEIPLLPCESGERTTIPVWRRPCGQRRHRGQRLVFLAISTSRTIVNGAVPGAMPPDCSAFTRSGSGIDWTIPTKSLP